MSPRLTVELPETVPPARPTHLTPAAAVIAAAAALVVALGLAHQPADPPADLSRSLGVLDEGIWSHNAVNSSLFGSARLDGLNPMYVTSAPHLLMRASYAWFGVGIVQTRLPSIGLAALAVLVVGWLWARRDALAGAVAATLLATTYLFLAYSRLGLLETPAAALATTALACLVVGMERGSLPVGGAGGALLAVAVTSKLQIAAGALGILGGLGLWAALHRRSGGARALAAAGVGFLAVGSAWALYVAAHLDAAVRAEWRQHALGIGLHPRDWIRNLVAYPGASDGFGTHARPLLLASATGLVLQAVAVTLRRHRPGPLQFAAAGWAVVMLGALAVTSYRPNRYAVLALPALALVAAGGIPALRSLGGARLAGRRGRIAVAAVALTGTAAAAALGLASWSRWAANPEWSVRDTADLFRRETRPADVIAGGWALVPATEAHRRVVVSFPASGVDARCPVERYGVDFLLIAPRDRAFFERNYPGLISPGNLVARPTMIHRRLELYRVPPGLPPASGCPPVRAQPVARHARPAGALPGP